MALFNISRLTTHYGTFKLTVKYEEKSAFVEVTSIDMMGTDGWVPLTLNHSKTSKLIKQLQPELLNHLKP